jgi:hypothetical protein
MACLKIGVVTYIMKNQFNIYSGKITNFVAISIDRPRTQWDLEFPFRMGSE